MTVVLWVWVTGGRNRLIPPSSPNIYIFVGSNSMNIKHLLTLSAAALLFATPVIASAESNNAKAKRIYLRMRADYRALKALAKKRGVSPALLAAATKAGGFADSDSDGVSDVLEGIEGSNSCDIDSDDDGIDDDDESRSDSNPGDSSSAEIEIKNTISAITGTTVTVGDYTFTINDSTVYRDGSSLSDYAVGDLVEVKGRKTGDTLFLRRIKKDDD